jgi:cobalt-zinc-cadmium efflux system outer membrane protein
MKQSISCALRAGAYACVLAVASPVPAATPDSLTLSEALTLTTQRNPTLLGFGAQQENARQLAVARNLPPPMSIQVELENFAGSGAASSTSTLETTLQLSRSIELGNRAQLRRGFGESELAHLEARQQTRRAEVLAEAARRFVHVLSDQAQLQATQRATELAAQARDLVQQRIRAGAASPVFGSRAEITLARARITQEHAEHELASSRVALSALWGESDPAFTLARGNLFDFPAIEGLAAYLQRLEANPEVLGFAAEARVLEARLQLTQAQRLPSISLSAGVRRLEALDDQAFIAGFAMPLGSKRRAEPEIRALRAERESLTSTSQSRILELKATLFALYQEILHARTEAQTLQTQIRPQAQQMVRTTDEGYRAGRFSLIELADARGQLLEIEQEAIRAAAKFHTDLIEIERLTGVAVHELGER